ncbi:MAG: radical SAM protein [Alphaproteobacteria bacterium]|nr:radical SAM protein [Alphaproteobacteria bacterium]
MTAVNQRKLLNQDKVLPFYEERKRVDGAELPPLAVELHWTSDCNYDCVHCSYGSRRQAKGRLSTETIQSVVDDLVRLKAKAVYLSGGGEPTMVKGWAGYAETLLDGGVEVALITNGVALRDKDVPVLRRFNYIAVSVYSTVSEEYEAITDSRFFDRQWQVPGMAKAADSKTVIGARCVINKVNYRRILDVYEQAREAGFDYILFIPAVDYEGKGIALGEAELNEVRSSLEDRKESFDPAFTNVRELLERQVHHYAQRDYRDDFARPPLACSSVDYRLNAFVNYCGGVWLCQPHIGNADYCIGNLNDMSFAEIWNAPRHREVTASLNRNFSEGKCDKCRSIRFSQAIDRHVQAPVDLEGISFDPFV